MRSTGEGLLIVRWASWIKGKITRLDKPVSPVQPQYDSSYSEWHQKLSKGESWSLCVRTNTSNVHKSRTSGDSFSPAIAEQFITGSEALALVRRWIQQESGCRLTVPIISPARRAAAERWVSQHKSAESWPHRSESRVIRNIAFLI